MNASAHSTPITPNGTFSRKIQRHDVIVTTTPPSSGPASRPTAPGTVEPEELQTISGDRGLDHEEKLIFELDHGAVGVDLPQTQISDARLGGQRRSGAIGLPGVPVATVTGVTELALVLTTQAVVPDGSKPAA